MKVAPVIIMAAVLLAASAGTAAYAKLYSVEGGMLDIEWEVVEYVYRDGRHYYNWQHDLKVSGRVQDWLGCPSGAIAIEFLTVNQELYPVRIKMEKFSFSEFIKYKETLPKWVELLGIQSVWVECR